mmetsp:Transcript_50727/g.135240  ORF Transcript_50727/g.135240 Transcript_50727/m.135240 type:complete len:283 (+) Transcript_50727:640-1488(+)
MSFSENLSVPTSSLKRSHSSSNLSASLSASSRSFIAWHASCDLRWAAASPCNSRIFALERLDDTSASVSSCLTSSISFFSLPCRISSARSMSLISTRNMSTRCSSSASYSRLACSSASFGASISASSAARRSNSFNKEVSSDAAAKRLWSAASRAERAVAMRPRRRDADSSTSCSRAPADSQLCSSAPSTSVIEDTLRVSRGLDCTRDALATSSARRCNLSAIAQTSSGTLPCGTGAGDDDTLGSIDGVILLKADVGEHLSGVRFSSEPKLAKRTGRLTDRP